MPETKDGGYILDDRPRKFDPETFEVVYPDDSRYDSLPFFNYTTLKFEYAKEIKPIITE